MSFLVSLDLLAVSNPGFGCICHSCRYLFPLLDRFLFIPLLFKEPHFFYEFEGAYVLEQIFNLLIVRLLEVGVLLVGEIEFFLVLLMHFRGLLLVQQVVLLQIRVILFLRFTHLLFVVGHSFLVLLFPFLVVGVDDGLHALGCLGQALRRQRLVLRCRRILTFRFM